MVRPKSLKNYSTDQMDAAIKTVKVNGMSMNRASKIHGVLRITLHDRISGNLFLLLQYIFLLISFFFLSKDLLCVRHFMESRLFANVWNGQILNISQRIQFAKVSPHKAPPLNIEELLISFHVGFCFHSHLKF